MEQFLGGLQVLLQWQNFLIIPVGLAIGIIVGAIPGLTSDLGLILCIPLTYGMDPTMAILMLCWPSTAAVPTAVPSLRFSSTPGYLGQCGNAV